VIPLFLTAISEHFRDYKVLYKFTFFYITLTINIIIITTIIIITVFHSLEFRCNAVGSRVLQLMMFISDGLLFQ